MKLVWLTLWVSLAAAENRVAIFNRTSVPDGWTRADRAKPSEKMHLFFALKHNNYSKLEERFWAVSDPKSPQWRNFLSRKEITDLILVSAADKKVVVDFLRTGPDNPQVADWADAISVILTVKAVELLFQTAIYHFKAPCGAIIRRAWGVSSLPQSVNDVVDFVSRLNNFPEQKRTLSDSPEIVVPGKLTQTGTVNRPVISRELIMKTYNIPAHDEEPSSSAGPVAFADIDVGYFPQSLNDYLALSSAPSRGVDQVVAPSGINVTAQEGFESILDLDLIMGTGKAGEYWYYVSKGWMYTFTLELFNRKKVPDIVTISYGQPIPFPAFGETGQGFGAYATRVNIEFMKLGLRGVSLFASSGNNGAWATSQFPCSVLPPAYLSTFPGASPYLTSVGGTSVMNSAEYDLAKIPRSGVCGALARGYFNFTGGRIVQCPTGGREHASTRFGSGGGFSLYEPRPAYQAKVVGKYLNTTKGLPATSDFYYDRTARAYPDVAAFSEVFFIPQEGRKATDSLLLGTSASAALMGSFATYLVNKARSYDGKPLGFLNPFLYQMYEELPGSFNDITNGSSFSDCLNAIGEVDPARRTLGFPAAPGWDAVTGLGSPVVSKWLAYLDMKLQSHECDEDDTISDAIVQPLALATGPSLVALASLAAGAVIFVASMLLIAKRTASSFQPAGYVSDEECKLLLKLDEEA